MHKPVLLEEVVRHIPRQGIHVDATLGAGGHLAKVCELGHIGKIIAIDRDLTAINLSKQNLLKYLKNESCEIIFVNDQFRNISKILKETGIQQIDSILFDLGVSSMQLDTPGRGFSFMRDEPLLMTMSGNQNLNAEIIVNEWEESVLRDALYYLADERNSKKIAQAIANYRKKKRIKTTFELVDIIKKVSGNKFSKTNPATKTFQAIRMLVNEELQNIEEGLNSAWLNLAPNGLMLVITFHSIEDRIVKQIFQKFVQLGGKLINKKPIIPSQEEILTNKRSRSAKLRIIQK